MSTRAFWSVVAAVSLALALAGGWHSLRQAPGPHATRSEAGLEERLQQDLLRDNLGKQGDPVLSALFVDIAAKHFAGQLGPVAVRWEPRLEQVGALDGQTGRLLGMFGAVGSRAVILLNPRLEQDHAAIRRALCHEMVHASLHANGDSTSHGQAFQAELRRLSQEGAFDGLPSDPDERRRLRLWLDAESTRLDAERTALQGLGEQLATRRHEAEAAVADLDAGPASPGQAERMAGLRDAYNAEAADANARVARFNRDVQYFGEQIARYNAMAVYPDGLDEDGPYSIRDELTAERAPSASPLR